MPEKEFVDDECDRCSKDIDGFRVMYSREELQERGDVEIPERWEDRDEFPIGTAGYYRVSEGQWAEYANEDEEKICDECMLADPEYQADYES